MTRRSIVGADLAATAGQTGGLSGTDGQRRSGVGPDTLRLRYRHFINKVLAHCRRGSSGWASAARLLFDPEASADALTDGRIEGLCWTVPKPAFAARIAVARSGQPVPHARIGGPHREGAERASWHRMAHRMTDGPHHGLPRPAYRMPRRRGGRASRLMQSSPSARPDRQAQALQLSRT